MQARERLSARLSGKPRRLSDAYQDAYQENPHAYQKSVVFELDLVNPYAYQNGYQHAYQENPNAYQTLIRTLIRKTHTLIRNLLFLIWTL